MNGRLRAAVAALLVLAIGGCAQIPTSGPVEKAAVRNPRDDPGFEIAAQPPREGAPKQRILEGFMHAMASRGDYSAARAYLLPQVRDTWDPTSSVQVYSELAPPDVTGDRAGVKGRLVGTLKGGIYTHADQPLTHDFGIVKDEHDQWRISKPPKGLLVSEQLFTTLYEPVTLYFLDARRKTLVPDQRYFLRSRLTAQAVMDALARGPRAWLAPASGTVVPTGATRVSVDSAGLATVDLPVSAQSLQPEDRLRLAAQLVRTLGQLTDVVRLRLTAGGRELSTTADDTAGLLSVSSVPEYSPLPDVLDTTLFALVEGRLVRMNEAMDRTAAVGGAWGTKAPEASELSVNGQADEVAIVTADRTQLVTTAVDTDAKATVRLKAPGLVRPQYVTGELWAMASRDGVTTVYRAPVDKPAEVVPAPGLDGIAVRSFRFSPDGARILVAGTRDGKPVVGYLRVRRTTGIVLDGWRPLTLTPDGPADVVDVAWTGATQIVVLGRKHGVTSVYDSDEDALNVGPLSQGQTFAQGSLTTSTLLGAARIALLSGTTLRRFENQFVWSASSQQVTAIAYPT